jgi:hypothetical protein
VEGLQNATKGLAACLLAFAVAGGVILVQTAVNYVWVTEAQALIEENIHVAAVRIFPADDPRSPASVEVVFNVTNAGKVTISILLIEFDLLMDDPSSTTPLAQRLPFEEVGTGSFSYSRLDAPTVPPGRTVPISVWVVVPQGTDEYDQFNTTVGGNYFPYILGGRVHMSFPDFEVSWLFFWGDGFVPPPQGVPPVG